MSQVKLGYDYEFQVRVLYLLMYDRPFFMTINSILKPEYFDNDLIEWVAGTIIKHHKKDKIIITRSSLDVEFKDSNLKYSEVDYRKLMEEVEAVEGTKDLIHTANKILDFCKRQNMKSAILKSAEYLSEPDENEETYNTIYSIIKSAVSAGEVIDYGYDYAEEVDRRYEEDARNPIATGWPTIDELMDGGLAPGELGVFVCPPKGGKSWLMVASAVHAATIGKKVLFITLELSSSYVGRRFDANITKIPVNEVKDHRGLIKSEIDKRGLSGNIRIKKFNKPTLYQLESFIDSVEESGFYPDIVFVDYADLIRGDKQDLRLALRGIYEDLRALGDTYEVPVWTASQSNRQSTNAEVITKDLIAEDFSKIMTADFILSLSSKGNFYVMANRFGEDEVPIRSGLIDKSCGNFKMVEKTTLEELEAQGKSSSSGSLGLNSTELQEMFQTL